MDHIIVFLKGLIIGVANIIPGVSGGTMALVLSIYERLINALHSISGETVKKMFLAMSFSRQHRENLKKELQRIDALFLAVICIGALSAIVALSRVMKFLLNEVHDPTYGFFVGLVFISAIVPYRMIKQKRLSIYVFALLAVVLTVSLTSSLSDQEIIKKEQIKYELQQQKQQQKTPETETRLSSTEALTFFFSGAIAISAMILPGISGSLILLLMDQFYTLMKAINDMNFLLLGLFAAGALLGLLLFTRVLNFLLARFHDYTMGFLFGLVLGSLWVIWPFKHSAMVGPKKVYLSNMLPASWGTNEFLTIITFLAGCVIVMGMLAVEKKYAKKNT